MKCPKCDSENPESSRFCNNCAALLTQKEVPPFSQTKTFEGLEQELERGNLFAGRYEVIEELGSGGMGKVYKAYDKKIKEIVALKLIRPELATKPRTLERFREEIRLARKIIHKNICRMYDLNEEQGTPYITMEYVPGEDLKSMIRMMGKLSPGQAIFIGKQVCAGLAEAHKIGIIHRDLKPKNIMVDREGNARIMDFGLARSLEEKGITGGRVMIGTAEYMSPEQAEGQKADRRSDLYSLGVILFEMVTGRLLFEGETALSVAVKHKTEPPPDPRKFNPLIPEALARVILRCLEKNKEKRCQTAEMLFDELDEIEKEFPCEKRIFAQKKPSILREVTQPFGRKKFLIPVFVVLAVTIAAFIIWRLLPGKGFISLPAGKPSLAILYFKNSTGDKNLDNWRTALTENLITELRRSSENLTVLSADSIVTVLSKLGLEETSGYSSEDLKAVAAKTRVSHILLCSYIKAADKLRFNYELKDVQTGGVASTGRIDGQGEEDFLRMTDDLAKKILADFNLPAAERPAKIPTSSNLAYKYYLLGRHSESKYKVDVQTKNFMDSLDWYEKALQEDPNFAMAYWGLGDLYQNLYVNTKKTEDFELTLRYYEKAYQIDQDLAGANAGLGWAYFLKEDNDKAYEYFKRAFELEPENPSINYNLGSFLRSIGLPEKAIKYYSNAINLGDQAFINYMLRARCYDYIGKTEEAVTDARRMLEMEPENLTLQLFYARMLIMQKKIGEAEKEITIGERFAPDTPDTPNVEYTKALLFAVKGEKEKALPLVKEAEKKPVYYTYLLSLVYAALGLKDEAIKTIELGIERGFQETQEYPYNYPFLVNCYFYDSLRDDPRFVEILRQREKKYNENLRKYGAL
jgi:serine/threonine protein kinase/Tfp pilus assembly protein PilF